MHAGTARAVCRGVALGLLALGLPAPRAQAQPEPNPQHAPASTLPRVRWPDVVRLVDRHPSVEGARLDVQAARAGVDAAGGIANPSLEGTLARGEERGGDASRLEWGLSLTVPLDWLTRRSARVRSARADVQAAAAASDALRQDVLLQLAALFWQVSYEQARVEALGHLAAQTASLAQTVRARVTEGEVRPIEGTRVDVEVERLSMELESARVQLDAQRRLLGLWLGQAGGVFVDAKLEVLPRPIELGDASARVRGSHPRVLAGLAQVRALASEVGEARSERFPALAVTAFTDHELDRRSYGASVSVDLPLWNWNSGAIARAEAQLAAERKRAEATARGLEAELIRRHADCQAALQVASRFQRRLLPLSEEAARVVARTYEIGESPLLDVLDARRTVLETRTRYLESLATAQVQCSMLRTLIGDSAS